MVHGRMARTHATRLSIALTGDEPPSEFRIFTAGKVDTVKGQFTFDEASAKSVMSEYAAHGIDLMIDYDHASLAGLSLDPAQAGKAAGWFSLEVRNGELWAVNVRWTPPAAEALKRKEWRFMSPAFATDKDGRVTQLLNVAITNLPATRRLEPLMAASVTRLGEKGMTLEEMMKVAEALDLGPEATLDDFLAKIGAMKEGEKKPEEKPDPAAELGLTEEEKPEEVAAALSAVRSLSGKPSFVASISDIRAWHTSHVELATERKKLADREAILESAERRKLTAERVTLGGRPPAAVWEDEKCLAPKGYFATMPIADFRALCADEIKALGGKPPTAIKPPSGGGDGAADGPKTFDTPHGPVTLSARELATCAEKKIDPKDYAARKPVKKD